MTNNEKFIGFLNTIKESNPILIESIENGFNILTEGTKQPACRTRPNPVFDANDPDVNDNKDHFPIGTKNQAQNALARVNQYTSVPKWYNKKSLPAMKRKVINKVKKYYPSIEISKLSYT